MADEMMLNFALEADIIEKKEKWQSEPVNLIARFTHLKHLTVDFLPHLF